MLLANIAKALLSPNTPLLAFGSTVLLLCEAHSGSRRLGRGLAA